MSYRKYFQKIIHQTYPETTGAILRETESHYLHISKDTDFAFTSKNPMDKRQDFTAYFLALIQVLHKRGLSYEEIKNTCLKITLEYVRPKSALHRWLKRLPPKLLGTVFASPLLQWMNRKVSHKGHSDGFRAWVITGKAGFGYGIDILECGICTLFRKHGAMQFTSILCEVDKITSGFAGLELIRTGTIAGGGDKCDFRFKRIGATSSLE
jgi:hypothetical protein